MSPQRALLVSRVLLPAALLVAAGLFAPRARAQEVVAPRVIVRKFPTTCCPVPIDIDFVPADPTVTLRISSETVNFFNHSSAAIEWSGQLLDNVCVSPEAVYNANLGPLGPGSQDCYFGDQLTQIFYFQNAGTLPLKAEFDASPPGWDLAHGVTWNDTDGCWHDPGTETTPLPAGCLQFGAPSPTPALTDSAFTTVQVSGLIPGQRYYLTAWWDVNDVIESDSIFLTIAILGRDITVVRHQSWGALKARYR